MSLDCIRLPRLLFPAQGIDLSRFAVIACDQFTAQPSYWEHAERFVGGEPSCLRLMLPEVWLSADDRPRIEAIHRTMQAYLHDGTLSPLPEGLMLIERDTGRGCPRRGVLLAFDLEAYDETPGADTPIRPTEATVTERVPARLAIRSEAPFELPHILLFLDDPAHTVLEPLFAACAELPPLYDFELMQGGGHITGRLVSPGAQTHAFESRLAAHAAPDACRARYGLGADAAPLVFATGDGNHSMAAAKAHWERIKATLSPEERETHPARWVLAELVNLHDGSICFEAVHRLLLDTDTSDALHFLADWLAAEIPQDATPCPITIRRQGQEMQFMLPVPDGVLPVTVLQSALDAYLHAHPRAGIDFIHGTDTLLHLADAPGRIGFVLPDFPKEQLFPYVMQDGVLPRKTFSMGTALEKRYYLEARAIR